MADLGEIRVKLTADSDGFVKSTSFARDALVEMSDEIAAAALKVVKLGADIAAASVELAGDFESSLVSAGSKANATAAELDRMRDAAIQAGLDSAFSAQQAADGLGNLAQAGFGVEEQIAALSDTLNLASAGEVEVAEAASIAANALNAFRMEAEEAGRVADVLVMAANNADTSVSELGKALGNAGGIAGQLGQELEGTVAIIGQMQNVGISAAEAGTAVRSSLAKLSDPAGKAAKYLERLGVSTRTADGELRQFTDILADMESKGAEAQDFVQAFGEEIGPKLATALSAGAIGLNGFEASLRNAGGEAERVAGDKLDTMNGALQILGGSVETLGIAFGEGLGPAVKVVAQELALGVNELVNSKEGADLLNETVDELVSITADLLDVLQPAVWVLGQMAASFIESIKPIRLFVILLQKISLAFEAVEAAARGNTAALKTARKEFEELSKRAMELEFGSAFAEAEKVTDRVNSVLGKISDGLRSIKKEAADAGKAIRAIGGVSERSGTGGLWNREKYDELVASTKKQTSANRNLAKSQDEVAESARKLAEARRDLEEVVGFAWDRAMQNLDAIKKTEEELEGLLGDLGPSDEDFKPMEDYLKRVEQVEQEHREAQSRFSMDLDNERRQFQTYIKEGLIDFARAIAESLGEGAAELAGLASNIGQGAAAGAQVGGPKGAVVGAALGGATGILGIASKTENFGIGLERVGEKIDELGVPFDSIGEAVNEAIRIFWPIAEIFLTMGEVLKPIVEAIKEVDFTSVAKFLFGAIKIFGLVWLNIADILTEITTFIWKIIAGVVRFIADMIAKVNDWADILVPDALVNAFDKMAKGVEAVYEGSQAMNTGIENAKESLKNLTFESGKLGEKKREERDAIESLLNVPDVFRLNLRRGQSDGADRRFAEMDIGSERLGGSSGNTSIFQGDMYVIANDPEEFERKMGRKQFVQTGDSNANPFQRAFQNGGF